MRPNYTRLGDYLLHESGAIGRVELSLKRIEEVVGAPLPDDVEVDLKRWVRRHPKALDAALAKAGWRIMSVSALNRSVEFTRTQPPA